MIIRRMDRWIIYALCCLGLMCMLSPVAAQPLSVTLGRGEPQGKIPWKVGAGGEIALEAKVSGGTPPYNLTFMVNGRGVETIYSNQAGIAQGTVRLTRPGVQRISVTVTDRTGQQATDALGHPVTVEARAPVPPVKPKPTAPAHPELASAEISGPSTIEVGGNIPGTKTQARYTFKPKNGVNVQHEWEVQLNGGKPMYSTKPSIEPKPKRPGTMTILVRVWDKFHPKEENISSPPMSVKVAPAPSAEAAAPAPKSPVMGWWIWMRPVRDPATGKEAMDQLPVHIDRLGAGEGYILNVYASLTQRGIPPYGTAPWKFRAKPAGNTLDGTLEFPGQAKETGKGTLHFSGGELSGDWVGPNGKQHPWKFRRATPAEASQYKARFGY